MPVAGEERRRFSDLRHSRDMEGLDWLIEAMKDPQAVPWTEKMRLRPQDTTELLNKVANGPRREGKKALVILGRMQGIRIRTLCPIFDISLDTVGRYWRRFNDMGIESLSDGHPGPAPKAEDETIKAAVFSVIHSPPSEHNINRTSWKFEDICKCLSKQGIHVSRNLISKIIRRAGYKWRRAKTVLTSNDPKYSEKLDRIKSILSTLGENDRFCSIDEFGPFAVKIKGGKRLVGPNEYPHVPQFQKSKGWLIVTAALELSQNQVTHFYSKAKNTTEMIKLLEVLLERYRGCNKLYFSWDAASWHASKALYEKVKSVNLPDYRAEAQTPVVELAPLPKSAQFLNVIESVFSGMARAIIHNSNYQSVEQAVVAIDRYFRERNEYFLNHPKKAGKTIWGNETVVSEFAESNNCKDPDRR